jgi:hypothetical protein
MFNKADKTTNLALTSGELMIIGAKTRSEDSKKSESAECTLRTASYCGI